MVPLNQPSAVTLLWYANRAIPKSRIFRISIILHHYVSRLDIAMDDSAFVGVIKRRRAWLQQSKELRPRGRMRTPHQHLQGVAAEILHHNEGSLVNLIEVIYRDKCWVARTAASPASR